MRSLSQGAAQSDFAKRLLPALIANKREREREREKRSFIIRIILFLHFFGLLFLLTTLFL